MSSAETALPRAVAEPAVRTGLPWTLLCLGLGALVVLALLVPPYPPLQDFSEWAYQGLLLARRFLGLPIGDLHLATAPIPNSSVQLLLGLLSLVMPAAVAARLFLFGLVAASVLVALALGRRWQPAAPGAFAALLLVAVFFHAGFWNGYANFQLGLVILGAWFLLPEERRGRIGVMLGLSLLLFFTHAMVFAGFCILLGMEALLRRRILATALGLLPAAVLTLWYVRANAAGGATEAGGSGGLAGFLAYKLYTLAKLGPYHNFTFAAGGDAEAWPALYWAGVAINLAFAGALVLALLLGLRAAIRTRRLNWGPLATAALLVGLFAVLPDLVQNVVNPGERLLLPALLMLLLVLPLPPRLVRGLGLGALLLAANLAWLLAREHDWRTPLHWTQVEAGRTALFRHRPTAFACKWQEMERAEAAGDEPRQPISFATSLLVGRTYAGCTGQPG